MSKIVSFEKHELVNLGKLYDGAIIGIDKHGRTVYNVNDLVYIVFNQFRDARETFYDGSIGDDYEAAIEYVQTNLDIGEEYVVIIDPEF